MKAEFVNRKEAYRYRFAIDWAEEKECRRSRWFEWNSLADGKFFCYKKPGWLKLALQITVTGMTFRTVE